MSGTAAPVLELTPEELLVKSYLERATDGSIPSILSLRLVQRFATETPELFGPAALALLQQPAEASTALRFVIVKLLQQADLMRRVTDPLRLGKAESIHLFRLLQDHDRGLDVRLAQSLPNRCGPSDLTLMACGRALDVLDEASAGRRVVPIIAHLVDHPAPALSAKATLVIGKRVKSVRWVKQMLRGDRKQRDRANAIETLWGLATSEATALFWDHINDKDNRVTGNAVMGLHLLGDARIEPLVLQMVHCEAPEFRWTAAWLLEKMRRQEYRDVLRQMLKDVNPGVRRSALRAMVAMRQEHLRLEAEAERLLQTRQAPEEETAGLDVLATETLLDHAPAPAMIEMPDFNIRLDGKTFSFRDR